jgi:hypothetical protein
VNALADDLNAASVQAAATAKMRALAGLLERSGIDTEDIGRVERVNVWQGFLKNADGEAELVDLAGISLVPRWADGPEWPVVQQAAPCVVKPPKVGKQKADSKSRTTVLLPDPQIGYWRLESGELLPIHDEACLALYLQVIATLQPDVIVHLGDFLDLPEWSSKFLVRPEFVLTTQPAIDRAHRYLAECKAAAPDAELTLLKGNHDDRLEIAVTRNALAAVRLRQANAPESWPVLSMPFLLRLEELGVSYVDGYPAGKIRLARGARGQTPIIARHGMKTDMKAVARSERQSVVQGHSHHVAVHWETFEVDDEPITVGAFSLGCSSRVDGVVPSVRGSADSRGRPMRTQENWQQAFGVLTEAEDGFWSMEVPLVHDGRCVFRGVEFTA